MNTRTWRNWLKRILGESRSTARPGRSSHLEVEQLEDRSLPSANPLAGVLMQPTYQLYHTSTQSALGPAFAPVGLDPTQVRTAYGFDKIVFQGNVAGDGSGQTIAIVDAFDDPTAAGDLTAFDQQYGLATANFVKVGVNSVGQASTSNFPTPDPDWSVEIALDVEWSHAIAPGAKVLLVEAASNSYSDLLTAVDYARHYTGVAAVSMSWGGGEQPTETSYDSYFTTPAGHSGVTFFASSGDSGPALSPSTSAYVVSVGGTSLNVDAAGDYGGETGWSGGGGGISAFITQPSYQDNLAIFGASANGMRAAPDVSYNADPETGVAILSTYGYGGWLQVGGTSAAAPQWAALMAITDQGRALVGKPAMDGYNQTLPALYSMPARDFHDVTIGNNGFPAGPGYDLVTGLGTPVANFLVPDLVGINQVFTAVAVTPANAILGDGKQLQLTAQAVDQFGRPMPDQPTFTWSINGLGTIDGNNVYSAPSNGAGTDTVTVTTTLDGITVVGSATLSFQPGPSITQLQANPGEVTGTTTTLSAQVSDYSPASLTYFWYVVSQPSGATAPNFAAYNSSSTTATFFQAGNYEFGFNVSDGAGISAFGTLDVTVDPTLTSIALTPATVTLANGSQQPFTATTEDQFGNAMASQPAFTWSVTGQGTIDAAGLYTSPSSGSGTDTVAASALIDGTTITGTAAVTYVPTFEITAISASPNIVTGTTTAVSATAANPGDGYVSYFWWVWSGPDGSAGPIYSDPGSATTTATFFEPGDYKLGVLALNLDGGMAIGFVDVDVIPTVSMVEVTPLLANVPVGGQQQFSAQALDQFYEPTPANFTWSMASGPGSVDANGLFTAPASALGYASVQATTTANGVSTSGDGYVLFVQPPAVTAISATPNPVTSTVLSVAAYDPNGSNLSYQWSVVGLPAGAKMPTLNAPSAATTGATFFRSGVYTFQVAVSNDAGLTTLDTINVTVNPVVTSVVMTPATATVPADFQQQFTATVFDQFQQPMTAPVAWSITSGPGSINSSTGLYTAPTLSGGTATIKATASLNGVAISRTATVTVLAPPTITGISASPTPVNGTATTLKVAATNPAGGTLSYHWTVLNQPSGAKTPTFSAASAYATAANFFQAGSYTFQVTVTNLKGSTTVANVNVTVNSVLTSIVMTPATALLTDGSQQQFTANAFDQFQQPLVVPFKWSMASGLGSVNANTGLYTAPAAGAGLASVKVSATLNGVTITRTATVTLVAAPTITGISATPTTSTTASLKAAATDANGGTLTYAWSVLASPAGAPLPTFSAGNANITSATFYQVGTYTFQVSVTNQFGQTNATKVSVTINATLTYVTMSQPTAQVPHATQQQFSVLALDQFHNVMATKPTIAWSLTGVGSINSVTGLYQAPITSGGSATIKAKVTVNGISLIGTTIVSVI